MFIRMTTIINNLDALDRIYTNVDIVDHQELKEKPKKNSTFKTIQHDDDENKKESNKDALRCYKCNKKRHMKVDCPFFENKKKNHHHRKEELLLN
ncbi:hypothetical protein NC653_016975 [Populus alba x Populus x berolinensis]|uniref:CCHC-type domain-containing protein n=1 Tax=Populus alba x Populus x berolinensis TaxID=444605 RepID=A0AAD6VZV4_9ROSI|nr:hypothetical protein NC653_016975 [Populus alba x Populus x berolinensis]